MLLLYFTRTSCNISHLTGRSVRPAVEEDDAVRVFATQNWHDWSRPDFDALLLQKERIFNGRKAMRLSFLQARVIYI